MDKTKSLNIRIGAAVFGLLFYLAYGIIQSPLSYKNLFNFLPIFSNNADSFTIEEYVNDSWQFVATASLPGHPYPNRYTNKVFTLPQPTDRIRIIHNGNTQVAHLDAVLLGGNPPVSAQDFSNNAFLPPKKFGSADYDVVDAWNRTLEFSWDKKATSLDIAGVAEDFKGLPYRWPQNGYLTYEIGNKNETYTYDAIPVSSHPNATRFAYFSADKKNLYVKIDWASDNTLDKNGDWVELGIITTSGLKTFLINNDKTEWGTSAYEYTDKVSWQHKTYSFAIPLNAVGIKQNDSIKFQIRYYGTDGGGSGGDSGGSDGSSGSDSGGSDGGSNSGGSTDAAGSSGGSAGAGGDGGSGSTVIPLTPPIIPLPPPVGSPPPPFPPPPPPALPPPPPAGPSIVCSPSFQTINTNQNANFAVSGTALGPFNWSAPGGNPTTGIGNTFSAIFPNGGISTITVSNGSQVAQCTLSVLTPVTIGGGNPPPPPPPPIVIIGGGGSPRITKVSLISRRIGSPFIYLSQGPYTGLTDASGTIIFFAILFLVSGIGSYQFIRWQGRKMVRRCSP